MGKMLITLPDLYTFFRIRRAQLMPRRIVLFVLLVLGAWYIILPSMWGHFRTIADKSPRQCRAGSPGDPDKKTYPSALPVVKVLQLTDSGELVDRGRWTDALYELKKVPKPKRVFVYVHGWRHNSDPHDSDLAQFTKLIARAGDSEKAAGDKRHVVGIYVGWDAATPIPILEYVTFWDRKRTADRISQSAIFAKLIGAVRSILNQQEATRSPASSTKDQLVVIGHSFGARIVYSALAQAMIIQVQAAHPGERGGIYKPIVGTVDVAVLINPALEAGAYTAFDSVRRYQERFAETQQPLFLTISTDNDAATRWAFPIGEWVGLARSEREMTTLGNYPEFFTHKLVVEEQGSNGSQRSGWSEAYCSSGLCLNRTDRLQLDNPFFVVTTTAAIIDGHNGIWGEKFQSWLWDVFNTLDAGGAASTH
jgi:pimeloyl-ACP methyl ester carboxylesterase